MSDFLLCDMIEEHIDGIVEVETLSFLTPWRREDFVNELYNNKFARYKVLMEENRVIAYGGLWLLFGEGHITNIAVHPEYRGMGLSKVIVEALLDCAKENDINDVTLEVRVSNAPAKGLYEKYGFEVEGIRKGYYQDTKEDGLIMWKHDNY